MSIIFRECDNCALLLLSVTLTGGVSNFHIAPVAGSTISIPKTPPRNKLPKYHPFNLKFNGTICSAKPLAEILT